jgi:ABC-type amino acid transport substrate-binding protein
MVGELELDPSVTPLRVLVNVLHPFAFQLEDGTWDGFTVELFDTIARSNGWSYTLERASSIVGSLEQLKEGEADLAFGGIAITSQRQAELEFSFPIFESGLMILVRQEESVSLVSFLLSHTVWTAMCLLLLSLIFAGHAFWMLEGARNPQLGAQYFTAIPHAIWWASTTISTVGYGDIVPLTNAGRLFAMFWMVFGMISVGFLSGTFSSQLTIAKLAKGIGGPLDLPGHVVATKLNSTSHTYLERNGITTRPVKFMSTAYDLLADGEVDAVMFDGPALLYYVVREGLKRGFRVIQPPFETQQYGVLCRKVGLTKGIDVPLLQMREDYRYAALVAHWFGQNEEIYKDTQHDRQTNHTLNFFVYGLTGSLFVVAVVIRYIRKHKLVDDRWFASLDLTPAPQAKFVPRRQYLQQQQQLLLDAADDAATSVDCKASDTERATPSQQQHSTKTLDILTRRLHTLEEKLDIMLDRLEESARTIRTNQPAV